MQPHSDPELTHFKREFHQLSGYNLDNYQHIQIDRRLQEILHTTHSQNLAELLIYFKQNSNELRKFLDGLSINVSEFFRNAERFQEIQNKILPELLSRRPRLRIWSAGSSIGAEIYSLLMILEHLGAADHCHFLASDIDRDALERARKGVFLPDLLQHVSKKDLSTFFDPCLDENKANAYVFKQKWREKVHFIHHDLLTDDYPLQFDLIACRNVMIYFTKEAKTRVYQQFYSSLREGGVLFVGGAEQLIQAHEIGYNRLSSYFYQKQKMGKP